MAPEQIRCEAGAAPVTPPMRNGDVKGDAGSRSLYSFLAAKTVTCERRLATRPRKRLEHQARQMPL